MSVWPTISMVPSMSPPKLCYTRVICDVFSDFSCDSHVYDLCRGFLADSRLKLIAGILFEFVLDASRTDSSLKNPISPKHEPL